MRSERASVWASAFCGAERAAGSARRQAHEAAEIAVVEAGGHEIRHELAARRLGEDLGGAGDVAPPDLARRDWSPSSDRAGAPRRPRSGRAASTAPAPAAGDRAAPCPCPTSLMKPRTLSGCVGHDLAVEDDSGAADLRVEHQGEGRVDIAQRAESLALAGDAEASAAHGPVAGEDEAVASLPVRRGEQMGTDIHAHARVRIAIAQAAVRHAHAAHERKIAGIGGVAARRRCRPSPSYPRPAHCARG